MWTLKVYGKDVYPVGEHLQLAIPVYCVKILTAFPKAGISLTKQDLFSRITGREFA